MAFVDVEQGNLRGLQEVVDAGRTHAEKRDLPGARLWIVAARATLHLLAGRWNAAEEDAESVLAGARLPGCIHPDLVVATVRMRLRGAFNEPVDVPEPFRSSLDGRHAEAAAWWHTAGSPFNEAMAMASSLDPDHRVEAVTVMDRLGAVGTADRLRRELRLHGVVSIPQRPTGTTCANPGGLTNRQLEVARLLARGLTNSKIATELFVSRFLPIGLGVPSRNKWGAVPDAPGRLHVLPSCPLPPRRCRRRLRALEGDVMDAALLAGSLSTALFVCSYLPMLVKAARTRDLDSYSRGQLVLATVGNALNSLYAFSLPIGPIWFLHAFNLGCTLLMLAWHLRYAGRRPSQEQGDWATPTKSRA